MAPSSLGAICDRIVFMDKGKVLAEGTLEELLDRHRAREIMSFAVEEPGGRDAEPPEQLGSVPGAIELVRGGDPGSGRLYVEDIVKALPAFLEAVEEAGLKLRRLECRRMNIDDLFVSLTGRRLDA